ncbi:hypothetical protein ANANG_G00229670 [Anguilla anguilla]|uniref:Uncharacterized protein n=1 Tax=Anguilla anguilla TaxID=7936 RepID=A0A9D3LXQ9_ANGAN|nr:hypothetical protein ANANG_G00229670 [Anguilla anguilla]
MMSLHHESADSAAHVRSSRRVFPREPNILASHRSRDILARSPASDRLVSREKMASRGGFQAAPGGGGGGMGAGTGPPGVGGPPGMGPGTPSGRMGPSSGPQNHLYRSPMPGPGYPRPGMPPGARMTPRVQRWVPPATVPAPCPVPGCLAWTPPGNGPPPHRCSRSSSRPSRTETNMPRRRRWPIRFYLRGSGSWSRSLRPTWTC